MRRVCICFLCLCFVLLQHCFGEDKVALPVGPGKQVAVFVALCDNVHQGIAPVPRALAMVRMLRIICIGAAPMRCLR